MLPRILLTLLLAAPITALAQYVTVGPNGQVLPAGSSVVVVGQAGPPVLTTPSVAFGTPPAASGISLSDRAGISNSTPATAVIPSASESYPVYSYSPNLPSTAGQPVAEGAGETAASTGRLVNTLGPSEYAGAGYVGAPAVPGTPGAAMVASLGEIAAKYKSSRPQNIRTYTNADADRLNAMNVRGVNINSAAVASAQAAQPQGQAAPTAPAVSAPQLSAGLRPSPGIPAQAGATTPQVSQPPSAEQDSTEQRDRLPASSTLLPLLGVFGLGCGALGLWLRKRFA
jgi:hypothetical protein